MTRKRLAWRCKTPKQQKDKQDIYNSKEWKALRIAKLRAEPYCEKCRADGIKAGVPGGWVRSAHCVHHIVPIETASTKEEMRRLALDCGLNGLMSLCDECHHKIHEEMKSFSRDVVKERADARQARWADNIAQRFMTKGNQDDTDSERQEVADVDDHHD